MSARRSAPWALALLCTLQCSPPKDERAVRTTAPQPASAVPSAAVPAADEAPPGPSSATPLLPQGPGAFAPSHLAVAPGAPLNGSVVTETESCAGCHESADAQWRASAHAFGSFNNPVYRVAIDRFRKDAGLEKSRFCAGCHDIALLVDGAMAKDVAPSDPRGHGGITCRVCHGIEATRPDGNGSYVLASSAIPIPKEGDAESLRQHKARMALAPLRTPELCGSCHRAFLGTTVGNVAHLVGQDELGQWAESAYAGSLAARLDEEIEPRECRHCHMPPEDASSSEAAAKRGKIASHRFAGAHTWMARMRGDAEQERRAAEMLRKAASIDIAAAVHEAPRGATRTLPADGAPVRPGESILFDVVVRNLGAGHRFPAGTIDAQDTWIEVTVEDAQGRLLAEAGTRQEQDGSDLTAHRFRALQTGDDGHPLEGRETNRFRAPAFNHAIPPRDAAVSRYRFAVPDPLPEAAQPLKVTARLRHRTRNLTLSRAVCADAKSPRGAAFAAEVRARAHPKDRGAFDPCAPQPVTDVGEAVIWVGAGAQAKTDARRAPAPTWRRMFDHALGMLHALQEQADEARPSLDRALADLPPSASRERAMVMALYAQVAVRQGRTDEALSWLDRAQALVPGHPALPRIRGEAFASVWRWREAIAPLRQAAEQSPRDDTAWMNLAIAYGSAGQPAPALGAAQRALALQPRDQDCLRVQSLALEALHAAPDQVEAARQAYLTFRSPDDAPRVRAACSKSVPGCALERIPVHVHALRRAGDR